MRKRNNNSRKLKIRLQEKRIASATTWQTSFPYVKTIPYFCIVKLKPYHFMQKFISIRDFKKVVKSQTLKNKVLEIYKNNPNIIIYYGRLKAA